ncbi:MAG: hypothetical protein A2149_00105 [Candidatus Schekmanbacteria bacterium RBG_16_38_11]|uniref:Uncharacterized protein n=1 Tax=Candidatus Schekmanbacteria bacterium RBG_16_38_11 TaxID=1817880 RepID=A0A1F7RR31_9BACT|nr:MAG: hypothetical protein A2149_00105 [Candidatus Schekmanbacteria bacterium RBG_16_38_11]
MNYLTAIRLSDNVITRSEATKQSLFHPPLEKGDRGGFEIAMLPEFILSMSSGWKRKCEARG